VSTDTPTVAASCDHRYACVRCGAPVTGIGVDPEWCDGCAEAASRLELESLVSKMRDCPRGPRLTDAERQEFGRLLVAALERGELDRDTIADILHINVL